MQKIIKSSDRGHVNFDWLDSNHTFSFGHYYNPANTHFGTCRVINDDIIAGGGGFPTHNHDNMEIITYILSGALEHKDSLGTGSVIRRGDIQRMSAGTGIAHSEFNHSKTEAAHLLQIWFFTKNKNIQPSYAQKNFSDADKANKLTLLASESGREGSVTVAQDIDFYASILDNSVKIDHTVAKGRMAWLHVAEGGVTVNGQAFKTGDGIGFDATTTDQAINISSTSKAEFLLFDMGQ